MAKRDIFPHFSIAHYAVGNRSRKNSKKILYIHCSVNPSDLAQAITGVHFVKWNQKRNSIWQPILDHILANSHLYVHFVTKDSAEKTIVTIISGNIAVHCKKVHSGTENFLKNPDKKTREIKSVNKFFFMKLHFW